MNEFLGEGYKLPVSSNYMKLKDGENTFRVLSSAIVGYEYWNKNDEPVRSKERPQSIPHDINTDKDGKPVPIKHFWAFVVWNYNDAKIQILELTQISIMSPIQDLVKNTKWGDPKNYDISVKREGSGFDTEYQVIPNPHTEIDPKVTEQYENTKINLEALFTGKDPFKD